MELSHRALSSLALALVITALTSQQPLAASEVVPRPNSMQPTQVGLSGVTDWSAELVWKDAFRTAREWTVNKERWGDGSITDCAPDAAGYPTRLPEGVSAVALMRTDLAADQYPQGLYRMTYQGQGTFTIGRDQRQVGPGTVEFQVQGGGGIQLRITALPDPTDHLRAIRVFPAIYGSGADSLDADPYDPHFVAAWGRFKVLRFMDWFRTNHAADDHRLFPEGPPERLPVAEQERRWKARDLEWDQRADPAHYTLAQERGVPDEEAIALCNRLLCDAWVTIPHRASDRYARRMAELWRDRLDPRLRIHLEYSNETWNFAYAFGSQNRHVTLNALTAEDRLGDGYHGRRSQELWSIWEDVFGSPDRLVRVMATQTAWHGRLADRLRPAPDTDVVALTSYWFGGWSPEDMRQRGWDASTVDGILTRGTGSLSAAIAAEIQTWTSDVADAKACIAAALPGRIVPFLAYEGGPHVHFDRMPGIFELWHNRIELGDALHEQPDDTPEQRADKTWLKEHRYDPRSWFKAYQSACGDPRMGDLYQRLTSAWFDLGAAQVSQFGTVGRPGRYGCWSLLDRWDQPLDGPSVNPRWRGFTTAVASQTRPAPTSLHVVLPEGGSGVRIKRGAFLPLTAVAVADPSPLRYGRIAIAWEVTGGAAGDIHLTTRSGPRTGVTIDQPGTYAVAAIANDGLCLVTDRVEVVVE